MAGFCSGILILGNSLLGTYVVLIEFYRQQKHLLLSGLGVLYGRTDGSEKAPSFCADMGVKRLRSAEGTTHSELFITFTVVNLRIFIFFLKLLASQFQHPLKHQPLSWESQPKQPPASQF